MYPNTALGAFFIQWDVIGWMERFQGVGTRYLDNYLYWFRWLELGKNFR